MDTLLNELGGSFPDGPQTVRIVVRLIAAAVFGAVIGYEREATGKAAGLRTHMLVSLSSAVFVLAALETNMASGDISRVIQGIAAGIGFIGAGAILKHAGAREVQGLTTAASIWLTAAVGLAAGLGRLGLSLIAVALALLILAVFTRIERHVGPET